MNKRLNFWIIITLISAIATITLVGLVMELNPTEVIGGDSVLGLCLMSMINKKETV